MGILHQLVQTALGGRVVCEERDLLYEEAPTAFKNIEAVIQDLMDAGLLSVIATFRPLLTYKTRKFRRRVGKRVSLWVGGKFSHSPTCIPARLSVRECKAARAAGLSSRA